MMVKMRKFSFLLLLMLVFSGCVVDKSMYENRLNFSEPLSIKITQNSKIYTKFTNTSTVDSNLNTSFRQNLTRDGYILTNDEKSADLVIKGNLEYFRRTIVKDRDPFLEYCTPRASFWGDCYDKRTNSYIYDASITLLVENKNQKSTTALNFISKKNINSLSTMMEIFNNDVYDKIIKELY